MSFWFSLSIFYQSLLCFWKTTDVSKYELIVPSLLVSYTLLFTIRKEKVLFQGEKYAQTFLPLKITFALLDFIRIIPGNKNVSLFCCDLNILKSGLLQMYILWPLYLWGEKGENNLNLVGEAWGIKLLTQCVRTAFIVFKLGSQVWTDQFTQ